MTASKGHDLLIAELANAVLQDPTDTDKLYELGRLLESVGRFQEALVQFRAIVSLEPRDHESVHATGCLLRNLGNIPEAIENLIRATELWDQQPDYFADLGELLVLSGDTEGARDAFRKGPLLSLPGEAVAERISTSLAKMAQ